RGEEDDAAADTALHAVLSARPIWFRSGEGWRATRRGRRADVRPGETCPGEDRARRSAMSSPRPESQPAQQQTPPGVLGEMTPKPDHGEESYRGSGKLAGKKAV